MGFCGILLLETDQDESHGILKGVRGMFIEEAQKDEKRRFQRVEFREPVRYHLKNDSTFGGCLAYDLSEGGMRINFNEFVPVNSEMILNATLPHANKVVDIKGRVAWLRQVPYSDRYHVGIEFTALDPVSHEELRTYVQARRF